VNSHVTILTEDDIWDQAADILNAHPELVHFEASDYDTRYGVQDEHGRIAADAYWRLTDLAWLLGRLEDES